MKSSKPKRYKALMLDIDGTLVPNRRDGMPSKRVRETVAEASQYIHIGVATSRPLFLVKHITDQLKLSGPSIINGGAQIIDFPSKKILWEKLLNKKDISQAFSILRNLSVRFFVHDDHKDITPSKTYIPKHPTDILCTGLSDNKADRIVDELSKISTVAVTKIGDWQKGKVGVRISHASATKQHAIFEVARILKIQTHEIIGVGDHYNDFPLLMACGLKVAMGNAVEDLKAIADYIAPSVEEDGVADTIEKFILNNY